MSFEEVIAHTEKIISHLNPLEKHPQVVAHSFVTDSFFLANITDTEGTLTLNLTPFLNYYVHYNINKKRPHIKKTSLQINISPNTPPEIIYKNLKIDNNNLYLGVPPEIIKQFFTLELFGSMYNTTANYFSAFSSEIGYKNPSGGTCIGTFFRDYSTLSAPLTRMTVSSPMEKMLANPPFIETFMTLMAKEIIKNPIPGYLVVCLPVWDSETQKALGLKNYNLPFEAYEILRKDPRLIEQTVLLKNEHSYYNYFNNSYSNVTNTHILCFGSLWEKGTLDILSQKWKKLKTNIKEPIKQC